MSPTHVQLVAAVALCVGVGVLTGPRPQWRPRLLAGTGLGFLVLVVGWWTPLLLALIALAYVVGRPGRSTAVVAAVAVLTAVLVAFKIRAVADGGVLGSPLFIPVGLSYLTFQLIGYLVDVRRERVAPADGPADLLAFTLLPPIRMSGPVLRFRDHRRSMARPFTGLTTKRFLAGVALIGVGLVKKRVFGDAVLDHVTGDGWPLADVDRLAKAAIQLVALYFDASGFADIAEGCALLVGVKLSASFSRPLTRGRSLTDFWRRWQMTVMGWFRDYVYAPIRGDGQSASRARLALVVSFVASAAWHGLHPVWFIWGLLTVGALFLDQRVAAAAGRADGAAAVAIRSTRRGAMYLYLFALTTLLLAADRETFDSVRDLFAGPLTVGDTPLSLLLLAVMVGVLVLADTWRTHRKEVPTALNVALGAAAVVALAWPGTIDPFVYQRF